MDETLALLAFALSVVLIIIGVTADYWIWWLPAAKTLRQRAAQSGSLPAGVTAFNGSTSEFLENHLRFRNRVRIIERAEMVEDRVGDMKSHFVVFVFVQALLLFYAVVRASEGLGKHAHLPVGATPADPEHTGVRVALRYIARQFLESWYAPIIETIFFFMAAYAVFLLLRDVKKLNNAPL